MARRTAAWAPSFVVLVISPLCGGALAGPLTPDPGLANVEHLAAAGDEERAGNPEREAAGPNGGIADEIKVEAARLADGKTVQAVVTLELPIRHEVVREVLGDYEGMPRFVPDIHAARMISSEPGRKRVEVEGTANFVIMVFPIRTTLDVVFPSDGSIAVDSVAGNLGLHGVMRVRGEGTSTRVDYRVRIVPDFWLPPLIGDFLVSRLIRRQFEGVVAEMHRRAGQAGSAPE